MLAATDIGTLIERRADVRGGRPVVAKTSVSVHRIAGWYKLDLSPEEIADNHSSSRFQPPARRLRLTRRLGRSFVTRSVT
ncbi:MAG: DUF433 domain-containing protein [Luteitalea sp.]|nr:DUF433 domain-containing protein [Luteitalea sp.]